MATEPFAELVGRIINNCGALELFTDNTIRALSKDDLLFNEIIDTAFARRIQVVRKLLKRANRHNSEIESLLNSILELAKDRNLVAHNPIASSDEQGTDSYVLVVRHKTGFPPGMDKLDRARLEDIAERSRAAMAEFLRLLPGARQVEPHSW
jgi:hypothetical protein